MQFFERRKARKSLHKSLRNAQHVLAMREDLFSPEEHAQFTSAVDRARAAHKDGTAEEMRAAETLLEENVLAVSPNVSFPEMRNFFEMWVTALAVAMAFRAYFYQPFRIPTNSMYPTLYGITSVDEPRDWADDMILTQIPKWLLTGSWYREIRATSAGILEPVPQGSPGYREKPGYNMFRAGGVAYHIPSDVFAIDADRRLVVNYGRKMNARLYERVNANDLIWAGRVTIGDFVFVNRWKWNFRRPQRGEVMIFSTQGIKNLPPGTHYIKRMVGLPNEKLEIRPPNVFINGQQAAAPSIVALIASGGQLGDWAAPYAGFTIAYDAYGRPREFPYQIRQPGDVVQLGPTSYYALGDNSRNSEDSRIWGFVPEQNLLGPGAVVYWPFINKRWGRIP